MYSACKHLQARQMVDGLGHGGADAQTDFATIVYQLRCARMDDSFSCQTIRTKQHSVHCCC
jgi:hypothetical protein